MLSQVGGVSLIKIRTVDSSCSDEKQPECLTVRAGACILDFSSNTELEGLLKYYWAGVTRNYLEGDPLALFCSFRRSCRENVHWLYNGRRDNHTVDSTVMRDYSQLLLHKRNVEVVFLH